jgi:hypothetical protein
MSDTYIGQICHDTFHSCPGSVTRGLRFDDLRPNARRLWGLGAIAARQDNHLEPGRAMYEGYFEATGLQVSAFMRWAELGPAVKTQWTAAGEAARAYREKLSASAA